MSGGGALWSVGALRKVRDESPAANLAHLIGLAGSLDSSLQIPTEKAYQLLLSAAQGGQPQASLGSAAVLQKWRAAGRKARI